MGWFNDIKNKIKNMINRSKMQALPEGQSNETNDTDSYASNTRNKHVLTRLDGSTIEIEPMLDKLGNQTYEQVFNERTGQFQAIPKYKIMSEELKQIIKPQILYHPILIDVNPQLLDDPKYADFIANSVLDTNRMKKIVHQYCNYAGFIEQEANGNLKKMIDMGIVSTLRDTRENNARKVEENIKKRKEEDIRAIIEKSQQKGVHIKTSHAEDLSGQEWKR